MAIRNIRTVPDEILAKKCRPVTEFDERLHELLDDMYETMIDASGAGLAAPQVGILRRVVVIDVGEGRIELVKETETIHEGCLSLPGRSGLVARPKSVTVRAQDRNGQPFEMTGSGMLARAFCHETDHLDGIMFTSKLIGELS